MVFEVNSSIIRAINALPESILARSGSVFYTGSSAFSGSTNLYILGLNPGGSPDRKRLETVRRDISDWKSTQVPWSAYCDQSWENKEPGAHGMQPRIIHMFRQLGLDLRTIPASNLAFVRSNDEAALDGEKKGLIAACWPTHAAVIESMNIKTILCFGSTAGQWTRERLGATQAIDQYRETNDRGWASIAHAAPDGRVVIAVTHPSRAAWTNPASDPSPLVARIIAR